MISIAFNKDDASNSIAWQPKNFSSFINKTITSRSINNFHCNKVKLFYSIFLFEAAVLKWSLK
jgi:hypothetical protein